ncbi:hypothetical protein ZWY2020_030354 [Hordeum vulgare]|nr:hypothetical protein ZWY2020_030354 [Hordeum vulgare]
MRRVAVSCSASGPTDEEGMTYKGVGVDIDTGTELVCRIRKLAPGIGFGGLYPHGVLLIFIFVLLVPIFGVDCRLTFSSELWLIADILGVQSTCLLKLSGLVPGTQNYNHQRPSQELVAKDLHGTEWKFHHIYRAMALNPYIWDFE